MNPDRILTKVGGNPNLLWSLSQNQLHVIDHNLSLAPHKMPVTFLKFAEDHVFGADLVGRETVAARI